MEATSAAPWGEHDTLICRLDADGILEVRLNRPEQLNAFTPRMCAELMAVFTRVNRDDAVRAVLVTGAGRAFCAGMDLADQDKGNAFGLAERPTPSLRALRDGYGQAVFIDGVRDLGGQLALAIQDCLKPVAAAINGPAVGIGATMTLSMDFRLASTAAKIGFVFGRIGIVPEACSSWLLPRLVGLQQALEWVYGAEPFGAEEALRGRLVRSIHDPASLVPDTRALLVKMTRDRSPAGMAMTRRMLWRNGAREAAVEAHLLESLAMHWQGFRDGAEGVAAFREKRSPRFTGRVTDGLPCDFADWWTSD
ncbi:enoyl-CoA hydratase-related protein [uncultured Brevundimonas sp.]|uniref:enoyl-CoA hydratase-related protein n=1 Tax=uncultured Brevundimonas sp. TaxID=213418 RepID=UPI0025D8F4F9|nr:enoyl-CoA hydratase-related protein [uncultured Brevundimonas sp.]